jgi:hypothetical protein
MDRDNYDDDKEEIENKRLSEGSSLINLSNLNVDFNTSFNNLALVYFCYIFKKKRYMSISSSKLFLISSCKIFKKIFFLYDLITK